MEVKYILYNDIFSKQIIYSSKFPYTRVFNNTCLQVTCEVNTNKNEMGNPLTPYYEIIEVFNLE